jgi:hypothetical protein
MVKALARDAEPDHDAIAHCISSQAEAAEAFGSGTESEHFPGMLDRLSENMKPLTGNDHPFEDEDKSKHSMAAVLHGT